MVSLPNQSNPSSFPSSKKTEIENKSITELGDSAAAIGTSLDNLAMAEKTARWLYSQRIVNGSGITWRFNNTLYLGLEEGASGIGLFYLQLFEKTGNQTYLTWANEIGVWLNYIKTNRNFPAGKWPIFVDESDPQNYTGVLKGAAGVGKFLTKLGQHTNNPLYDTLAQEIADYYISIAQTSNEGTGLKIRTKDVVSKTGPDTIPTVAAQIDDTVNYGSQTGVLANLLNFETAFVDYAGVTGATYSIFNNDTITETVQMSIYDNALREADTLYQTFTAPHYPFYVNQNFGVSVRLYTNTTLSTGYMIAGIYEADSYGMASDKLIGSLSNKWYSNFTTTNTQGMWASFNWTGKAVGDVPVLNGTAPYGYCLKIQTGPQTPNGFESWDPSQAFFVKVTTKNNYTNGRLTTARTINNPRTVVNNSRDLCFNLTVDASKYVVNVEYSVDSTEFGLPSNYDTTDITSLIIHLRVDSDQATPSGIVQLYNVVQNKYDNLKLFADSYTDITYTLTQPEITSYVSGTGNRAIKVRVMSSYSASFSIHVDQLNLTMAFNSENYVYSWGSGVAGIADYFIDMYESTSNVSYLQNAQKFANFIVEDAIFDVTNTTAYWTANNRIDVDYAEGLAGIIDVLIRIAGYSVFNNSYIRTAIAAGKYMILSATPGIGLDRYNNEFEILTWDQMPTGYASGLAGIGSVLTHLAQVSPGVADTEQINFYQAAKKIGNTLGTVQIESNTGPFIDSLTTAQIAYGVLGDTTVQYSFASGMAGTLLFLSELQQQSDSDYYGEIIGAGLRYINTTQLFTGPIDCGYWSINDISHSNFSYFHGMAGIGFALTQIGVRALDAVALAESVLYSQNSGKSIVGDRVIYGSNAFNGIENGIAGVGMGLLDQYQTTGVRDYYDMAKINADMLKNTSYWCYDFSASTPVNFTGMAKGFAGIGTFLLEMYRVSGDSSYLAAANLTTTKLVLLQNGDGSWPVSSSALTTFYTNVDSGAAGVIAFLIDMYQATQNATILSSIQKGLSWLGAMQQPSGAWNYADSFGYTLGAAGIADVFLEAYELTGNALYLANATKTAVYLGDQFTDDSRLYYTGSVEYLGIDAGYAGVVKFLLHMRAISDPAGYIKQNMTNIISRMIQIQTSGTSLYWPISISGANKGVGSANYINGTAGIIEVLTDAYNFLGLNSILTAIYNGKNWILSQSNLGSLGTGYYTGINGLSVVLNHLPNYDYPTWTTALSPAVSSAISIQYSDSLNLTITPLDMGASIGGVILNYKTSLAPTVVNTAFFTGPVDSEYSFTIPEYKFNTTIEYFVVVKDMSGLSTPIFENNALKTWFKYTVDDTTAPVISNVSIWGYRTINNQNISLANTSLTYGNLGGIIKAYVAEPTNASGLNSVSILWAQNSSDVHSSTMLPIPNEPNMYKVEIVNFNLTALANLTFIITANDKKDNYGSYVGSTAIGDNIPPLLHREGSIFNSVRYYAGEKVPITLNLTDDEINGGSGLKRVIIKYSPSYSSNFSEWLDANCTYNSKTKLWSGEIPGQASGSYVSFFIVAEDNSGNLICFDRLYEQVSYGSIPEDLWFYNVQINWPLILTIVGSIAGVMVVGFLLYTRTGSYLDRMRRQSTVEASMISIKERFLAVYYRLAEFLNKLGDKIENNMRRSTLGERIKEWTEDHINSPFVKFFVGIGQLIKAYFRAMLIGVIAFPVAIWKLITGLRVRHVVFGALIGMVLIVASVVKYFGADVYPLRAVFFIDLGFVLFIGSFVALILHLLYDIAYK